MPGYQYRGTEPDTEKPTTATARRGNAAAQTRPVVTTKPALPVWEEPPAARRIGRGSDIPRIVATLQQHPGKWARVRDGLKSTGNVKSWRDRGCEAVTRKPEGSDKYAIWARWPEGKK